MMCESMSTRTAIYIHDTHHTYIHTYIHTTRTPTQNNMHHVFVESLSLGETKPRRPPPSVQKCRDSWRNQFLSQNAKTIGGEGQEQKSPKKKKKKKKKNRNQNNENKNKKTFFSTQVPTCEILKSCTFVMYTQYNYAISPNF